MFSCNIDEIMNMLDWNNPVEIQEKGVILGGKVRCINVFLQPGHEGHKKNVWENCAKILYQKSDEELRPYLFRLLEWLEDSNWPGYFIILKRLLNYKDMDSLVFNIEESVKIAKGVENDVWLINLTELLNNTGIKKKLSRDIRQILLTAQIEIR